MCDERCEAIRLFKNLEKRTSELQTHLVDVTARLRLLDANNAEDLQELFNALQTIQAQFNTPDPATLPNPDRCEADRDTDEYTARRT